MSRLHFSNSRGRTNMFSSPRQTQKRSHPDDTYQEKPQKKRRGGAKRNSTAATKSRRKQTQIPVSEDQSSTSGDEADGEDDEDEDNDVPAVVAPSQASRNRGAGRYKIDRSAPNVSDDESMFGDLDMEYEDYKKARQDGVLVDPDNEDFETELFTREDDEALYEAVEEISDSDSDNASEAVKREYEQDFREEFNDLTSMQDDTDPASFLNQIEGMSQYGFGETSCSEGDLQFAISSQSSDDGKDTLQRHVRFEDSFPEQHFTTLNSDSPTMMRALLPSALPAMHSNGEGHAAASDSQETDSDLTDDCLPEVALRTPRPQSVPHKAPPSSASQADKKTPRLKGPPCGTFIDDGVKSAGTLDGSGKMLIITNPQHLGEEFAKRYGASAPASPTLGFAEAVLDDDSQASETGPAVPDPMISSLNTIANASSNGQAEGPPYAFYAPADPNVDYALALAMQHDEIEGSDFGDLDPAEARIDLETFIAFDSEPESDSPMSPIFMSSQANKALETPRKTDLAHLNNSNLMSFRRNNDPAYAALQSSPLTPIYGRHAASKPRNKKRKARTESPYNNAHYAGVTPVQRRTRTHQESANESPGPSSKRQRITTS